MKFTFLGTGAADWNPESEGYRAFTSTLVNQSVLIDGTTAVLPRLRGADVTDILYTHSHNDHFDPELLRALAPVTAHIHSTWAHKVQIEGVTVVPFEIGETFTAGGLTVTAAPANHVADDRSEECAHFVLQDGEKTVYYATDGGWMTCREWHIVRQFSLDGAIFDATLGEGNPGDFRIFEHNSIEMLRIMIRTLRQPMCAHEVADGHFPPVLKAGAPVYLTHMARTLHPFREVLERTLAGEFIPAYDGMQAEI